MTNEKRVDVTAVCRRWGISRPFFYRLIKKGEIKAQKHPISHRWQIDIKSIQTLDRKMKSWTETL
jgi:hypothetical protein